MPTGYTSKITKDMTLEEFVLVCAHAFVAFIDRRDGGIIMTWPKPKEDPHHTNKLRETELEHQRVMFLSEDDIRKMQEKDKASRAYRQKEGLRQKEELKAKYERMLKLVEQWECPKDITLKAFMLDQLTQSLEANIHEYYEADVYTPDEVSAVEWKEERLRDLVTDMAFYQDKIVADRERTQKRKEWIESVRASLEE